MPKDSASKQNKEPRPLVSGDVYTISEAALIMRTTPKTVWQLIRDGFLPRRQMGRRKLRLYGYDIQAMLDTRPADAPPEPEE